MNLVYALGALAGAFLLALAGTTRIGVWLAERNHPPVGEFEVVNGTRMHFVHAPAGPQADLPPIVFIHGASGNLLDPMVALRKHFEGRAQMLFVDRPGHGWSERGGDGNATPDGQAATIAALMERLGIGKAVIYGHSFGGAIAAAFAVTQPEKTAGLMLVSAATHPWPGGETSWYYALAVKPLAGWLFSQTLSLPAGWLRLGRATACVFSPNRVPDGYSANTAIPLVLRPAAFRYNARDVEGLFRFVSDFSPRYREITVPAIIVSGDRDTVVYEEIHSIGLARDIPGAELVWVRNLGHKPDYTTPELIVAAVEKIAGSQIDLDRAAAAAGQKLAGDRHGPAGNCPDEKPASGPMAGVH